MKERPILFSGPMVRAILEDRKTMTRRMVKPQPTQGEIGHFGQGIPFVRGKKGDIRCPYGQPGDRLWGRESGWERPYRTPRMMREGADTWAPYYFDADDWNEDDRADFKRWGFKRRPSIHMPRCASRILLEITSVRVERLQDISELDAWSEGCEGYDDDVTGGMSGYREFSQLWEQINGPGSWDADPWVWVIEFRRVKE